jgi:hypothetical protein
MDGYWHFVCPECGFGDREHGRLAQDQDIICDVCLEDSGIRVRLRRWLPENAEQERQPS